MFGPRMMVDQQPRRRDHGLAENKTKNLLKAIFAREAVKLALRPLLRWKPLREPKPGYSIILGVPWHLRHLLPVNLRFVAGTDLAGLDRIHIVFDRRHRPEFDDLAADARRRLPDLPLTFHHYPPTAGRIIEWANVSTFYNGMNCATALRAIETRYAILHDFDLYPVNKRYFREIFERMNERQWRFCGLQRTHFDGLTDEDNILGTWALGMDVAWLRENHRPIDIFHKVEKVRGKWTTLDPFSAIQRRTPERGLVGTIDGSTCRHVGNLCATYLRFQSGQRVRFGWKLHYLWYLEALNGEDRLEEIAEAMEQATDGRLVLGDFEGDFSEVDPTCANVLRRELKKMDELLHGHCRPHVERYVDAFEAFLTRAAGDGVPVGPVPAAAAATGHG